MGYFKAKCIFLNPIAASKILTDKDRIGKYFVQDWQKLKREEQGRGRMLAQEGKKHNERLSKSR